MSVPPTRQAPLTGLKVVELARILAGPWAGQVLADLGADVIKVESPQGDDTRTWGPPFVDEPDGSRTAGYYFACNRGKRGVVADFTTAEGQQIVRDLVADADVLIENFKVGGLAKYGLDYPALRALNPRLVYCSITGFGQDGPYAHRPGYDYIIQGMSGIMDLTGEPDGQPQKIGVAHEVADELPPLRRGEIGDDDTLAAVAGVVIAGGPGPVGLVDEGRPPGAGVVTVGAFDLHHLGTEICEHLTRPGTRENAGELDDLEAGEGGRLAQNAAMPVIARPRIRAWTSWAPS